MAHKYRIILPFAVTHLRNLLQQCTNLEIVSARNRLNYEVRKYSENLKLIFIKLGSGRAKVNWNAK